MSRLLTLFLCLSCLFAQRAGAQAPVVEWQKCFGSYSGDYSSDVLVTSDGGYLMTGYTYGTDGGDLVGYHGNQDVGDIWLVKTDSEGNLQWQKCLGDRYFETGASIIQTTDGGYILAATSASRGCDFPGNHNGSSDLWVVKLTATGAIQWNQMYGGSNTDYGYAIDQASDGGYFVAGVVQSTDGDVTLNHGNFDGWVIKISPTGSLQWQKSFGGSADDEFWSVKASPDGGCIAVGFTESADGDGLGKHGSRDGFIIKLDNGGNLQWRKCFGGSSGDELWSAQVTSDGGFIVAGGSSSNDGDISGNHQGSDFVVAKLSNGGVTQWQKCYGGSFNDKAYFVLPVADGGYLVAGEGESPNGDLTCNQGLTDECVIKIDAVGNLQWQTTMGGSYYDEAFCVRPVSDGGFIVAGTTCSPNVRGYHAVTGPNVCGDYWLVKLSSPTSMTPPPVVSINPTSANICPGTMATLNAVARYAGTNPSYQWTVNGLPVGQNSPTFSSLTLANNDVVGCTVTAGGGCATANAQVSDAVTIKIRNATVNPQLTIIANNTVACTCTSMTFTASLKNAGVSPWLTWRVNGTAVEAGTPTFTTRSLLPGYTVTCTYTDKTDCVVNGQVVSNAVAIQGGTGIAPSISVGSSSNSFCLGSLQTFIATAVNAGTNPSYQWKVNGINSGVNSDTFNTSSLVTGDVVSCDITVDPVINCASATMASSNGVTVNITSPVRPSVTITPSADTICAGSLASFSAAAGNAGTNASYQWRVNGTQLGVNDKNFSTSSLQNGDMVSCTITADPQFSCITDSTATSNTIAMTVTNGVPSTIAINAAANNVCYGSPITFSASSQNAGVSPTYQWKVNGSDAGTNNPAFESSSLSNGDVVSCVLIPGSGSCSNSPVPSNGITATINYPPLISITPSDTIMKAGGQLTLQAVIPASVASYQWSPPSQLVDPSSQTPTTVPVTANTTYMLTAVSDQGCSAIAYATVKVFVALYMPTAFTPNGDGSNDIYRIPPNVAFKLNEFAIYNRWGQIVFSTKDISRGWDGTIGHQLAATGVYIYLVKGTSDKGKVLLKGTFTLIR